MTQASCYQPRKGAPGALALVIALHAAGITGLALWKIDISRTVPPIIDVWNVPLPDEPDPIPPEPVANPQPQPRSEITYVPPVVDRPVVRDVPLVDPSPTVPPPVWPTPAADPVEPAKPPAPWIEHAAKAKGDVRQLFRPDDYPAAAVRNEETGDVRAALAIGADGKVTGCTIVASSGSAALDQATCRILKARARFIPAKDSAGRMTTDSYTTPTISWRLTDDG